MKILELEKLEKIKKEAELLILSLANKAQDLIKNKSEDFRSHRVQFDDRGIMIEYIENEE
jgi:hypothetical protein